MSKRIFSFLLFILWFIFPSYTQAYEGPPQNCSEQYSGYVTSIRYKNIHPTGQQIPVEVTFNTDIAELRDKYVVSLQSSSSEMMSEPLRLITKEPKERIFYVKTISEPDTFTIKLQKRGGLRNEDICTLGTLKVYFKEFARSQCKISMPANVQSRNPFEIRVDLPADTEGLDYFSIIYPGQKTDLEENIFTYGGGAIPFIPEGAGVFSKNINRSFILNYKDNNLSNGDYTVTVLATKESATTILSYGFYCAALNFRVSNNEVSGDQESIPRRAEGHQDIDSGNYLKPLEKTKTDEDIGIKSEVKTKQCFQEDKDEKFDPQKHVRCTSAAGIPCGDKENPGFQTAIGCIHTEPEALIKDFLTFALAISGGLAFLLMILGAFQMITSAGNPDTLNAGKERLTSAVIGLLFVIFAVLLLQIIGVDILKLPGFGR